MLLFFYLMGIILLVLGIALNLWINKRRFYRRGPAGLQHFDSYSKSVVITFGERLGKIIAWLFIVVGVGALLYGHKIQTDPGYPYGRGRVVNHAH